MVCSGENDIEIVLLKDQTHCGIIGIVVEVQWNLFETTYG
jgi:hypothetical protein